MASELPKIEEIVGPKGEDLRKPYMAQVSFSVPDAGTFPVLARDEAHARELLGKMLANVRDLVIHDIFPQSQMEKPPAEPTPAVTPPTNTQLN